ncbi:GDSL-type esterase/lipase family protein [Alteromonadaceae bacterium BrNp21-10]|nr:GDSL-type esterase/lipase family protein [Alteromonadaceae bacterium BrNp21-10]
MLNQLKVYRQGLLASLLLCCVFSVLAESTATQATPRIKEHSWMSVAQWQQKHQAIKTQAETAGDIDVLFVGDSITEGWQWGDNQKVFDKHFSKLRTLNMGIGGDQTQEVLWRLQDMASITLHPKVITLLIGVNNFGHSNHSAEEVFSGVKAVVETLSKNYPQAQILINGILPYDASHSSANRLRVRNTNTQIAVLAEQPNIHFVDFGGAFLNEEGDISAEIMADFLHPTALGYQHFAEQLLPSVQQLLRAAK